MTICIMLYCFKNFVPNSETYNMDTGSYDIYSVRQLGTTGYILIQTIGKRPRGRPCKDGFSNRNMWWIDFSLEEEVKSRLGYR